MADKSSQQVISFDKLLRELPERDLCVEMAALIYLRWADFQEAEQEAIAAFDGFDYRPVLPSMLHWRSWYALPAEELQLLFLDKLPHFLDRLNNSRQNSLATQLHRVAQAVRNLGRLSPRSLGILIHWLADQPFETANDRRALLNVYDSMLEKRREKSSGEFRTPPTIASLIVELAKPVAGERIYDPSFGSAELLTAASDYVLYQGKQSFNRSGAPLITVAGIERNPNVYVIGLMRLSLAGIENPKLELGNSLERLPFDNPQHDGFDVVLCNPPWEMRANLVGIDHYPVRTTDSTGLFIQHSLSQLRPDGRIVILAPQGILFRSGLDQHLRRSLLEQHTVEAVVALPASVFMPHTSIRSSLLMLRRGGRTDRVRMADAAPFFQKSVGGRLTISRADLTELVNKISASEPSDNCWDVNAESIAESDWDLSPRRRDQSGLSKVLDSLRSEVKVAPLKEHCQVLTGKAYRSEELCDLDKRLQIILEKAQKGEKVPDGVFIPYIRIKDIKDGWADKASSSLSMEAASLVDSKWKLRAGDVLLSRAGTVGKSGIVRNGAVGGIAANNILILRSNQEYLDPHFLLAYLQSAECRFWLGDRATGTTIQHLSKKVIDELPIPLPQMQIQQRVAAEHREHGVDALVFLAQLLIGGIKESIAEWIDEISEILPANSDSISEPLNLAALDRVATEIKAIRNEAAHGGHSDSPLTAWILQFSEALSGLRRVQSIPRGPGLLSVLQESARNVKDSLRTIKGNLPNESKARGLTRLIADWLGKASSALLEDIKLVFSAEVESLPVGETVEFNIQIRNQGALPIRDLRIGTTPDWGNGEFGFLPENEAVLINLAGTAPKSSGTFSLTASWSGSKLDGQYINGVREIPINIVEPKTADRAKTFDIGGSPYICGDPVRPERNDVFFGREDLLESIRRQITKSGNVVLLEGNRRTGKSSILYHLEGLNAIPGWIGIICDFQKMEGSEKAIGIETAEIFRKIANSIAKAIQELGGETPLPNGKFLPSGKKLIMGMGNICRQAIKEGSAFTDFSEYVEVVLNYLRKYGLRLLLMLDEFEKLQEGIDSGITSPQVPENIRSLIQGYSRLSAILTGSPRLKRLREEYWSALYGLGTAFPVKSLSTESARRLIIEPVKDRLAYSQEAVDIAIYLTSGHPFLLQCLCNRIFEMATQLKTGSVTIDMVDQASDALIDNNEHFAHSWDDVKYDRRRFLLALCHWETDSSDTFSFGVIQEKLISHGIEVEEKDLIADLESLRELELIDKEEESSGSYYTLAIPLMGKWIERQHDFDVIKSRARSETEDLHGQIPHNGD